MIFGRKPGYGASKMGKLSVERIRYFRAEVDEEVDMGRFSITLPGIFLLVFSQVASAQIAIKSVITDPTNELIEIRGSGFAISGRPATSVCCSTQHR